MKLRVSNSYIDGHECERIVDVEEPEVLDEAWWLDEAYPHTGCGTDHSDAIRTCDSIYEVEVVEAENPDFLGKRYEYW